MAIEKKGVLGGKSTPKTQDETIEKGKRINIFKLFPPPETDLFPEDAEALMGKKFIENDLNGC